MSERAGAPSTAANDVWTSRRLLEWMARHFESRGLDSPRLTAELLLANALDCERMRIYMEVDRPATPAELEALREIVRRVALHEPVQYVIGEGWFYGRAFEVSRSTMIPRPSTESLVESVINDARERKIESPRIADIGTGTGCIAITLAAELPEARVVATDLDDAILALAMRNAERHGVEDRVGFRAGALFEPLRVGRAVPALSQRAPCPEPEAGEARPTTHAPQSFDYIVSNPPYIPDHEWADVAPNVKDHEPARALRGGADGLDVIRPLISGAAEYLAPGGRLVIEIADCQRDQVIDLVNEAPGLKAPRVLKDHEGLNRALWATTRM